MPYFDKNGTEIKAGMLLRFEGGLVEKIYDTVDAFGNPDPVSTPATMHI